MTREFQLNGGNLGYNSKTVVYTNLSSDITRLGDILLGCKILGEKNIKQRVNMSDIPKDKEGKKWLR